MEKIVTFKKFKDMSEEELAKWCDEEVKGVNFDNHGESYNFHMGYHSCLICGERAAH